jgi:rare lipoprotein A
MMKSILFLTMLTWSNISLAVQSGTASWYGPGFHGKKTASGQIYNMHAFTAAHRSIRLGTKVKVTNLSNNKSVIVLINDRGPFGRGRIIDLSNAAKKRISMGGTARVSIEIIR